MKLNIKHAVNGLVAKTATKVGVSFVLERIRDAAKGAYGPAWRKRYEQATAAAPWTGLLLACATAGFLAVGDLEKAAWVGSLAGMLMTAGVISRAYLTELPPALRDSKVYQTLVSWAPTTTLVLGVVWAGLEQCTDPACANQRVYVLVAAAIAAKLGLTSAALKATPPTPPPPPNDGLPVSVKKAA